MSDRVLDPPAVDAADPDTLGTKPSYRPPVAPRSLGPLIRGWRLLTSMRTALILLFLLALGVVPGSLLPQRSLNPTKVAGYLAAHPTVGPVLDKLSAFNVFGAPWFAAIYILLFVSLIGCLTPRIRLHLKALAAPPPRAPRHLSRLRASTRWESGSPVAEFTTHTAAALRRSHWRVRIGDEPDGVQTISAEKGYLRETGNLIFHVALTVLLVAVAIGKLWGYTGSILVSEGQGFCNTVQQYDSYRPGQLVKPSSIAPFCMTLNKFSATYDSNGTASSFRGAISYGLGTGPRDKSDVLQVNHPLRLEGVRLYLLGHGFSPTFRVTPKGGKPVDESAPFLPMDSAFTSQGVVEMPDLLPSTQLAIEGIFAPTGVIRGDGTLSSLWPAADRPAVAVFFDEGNLGVDTGKPHSVYSIDPEQFATGALKRVGKATLQVGQSHTLPDGTTVTFTGYKQWASLQVSRDPSQDVVLGAAAAILLGLLSSMRVRRRRVWLRAAPGGGPADPGFGRRRSVIAMGGLSRTDAAGFAREFETLAGRLAANAEFPPADAGGKVERPPDDAGGRAESSPADAGGKD